MIKNLVVFGCGWTHGVESKTSYPQIIANHFNWTLIDFSGPITTLGDMIDDFEEWVAGTTAKDREESFVLIGLTNEDRASDYKEDFLKSLNYQPENFGEQNYIHTVNTFNRIATHNNINLLQFNVLTRQYKIKLPTLTESSSALEMLAIRDKPRKEPLFTEHKFPNEKGHQVLADFLIEKINSAIIVE